MDIFIKSFGRPYYLERCLQSIQKYARGNYRLVILDDGTEQRFLEKIRSLFQNIEIVYSPMAEMKRRAVEQHITGSIAFSSRTIPHQFWRNEISKGARYFLLLEEDGWLTEEVDLDQVEEQMGAHGIVITKLFWGHADDMVRGQKTMISKDIETIQPQLPRLPRLVPVKPFLQNNFRLRSVLVKMKFIRPDFLLPFYSLYTVSSAVYRNDYWQYCMQDDLSTINEGKQLSRAVDWIAQYPSSQVAKMVHEVATTTYQTATFNNYRNIDFDMISFNHWMSEQWMNNSFGAMDNFPRDFDPETLRKTLPNPDNRFSFDKWLTWIEVFKGDFQRAGLTPDA